MWCYYLRGVEGETWVTMTTYRTTHYTGQRLDMGTGTSQSQRAKLNFAEDASTVGSDNIGSKNGKYAVRRYWNTLQRRGSLA